MLGASVVEGSAVVVVTGVVVVATAVVVVAPVVDVTGRVVVGSWVVGVGRRGVVEGLTAMVGLIQPSRSVVDVVLTGASVTTAGANRSSTAVVGGAVRTGAVESGSAAVPVTGSRTDSTSALTGRSARLSGIVDGATVVATVIARVVTVAFAAATVLARGVESNVPAPPFAKISPLSGADFAAI